MLFLRKQEVLDIHTNLIEKFGGTHGIRDEGALESALAATENRAFYENAGLPICAKIPGSENYQLVEPDKKKYAAYYRALRKHGQLEGKWYEEDQRNLYRLIGIRGFLWT